MENPTRTPDEQAQNAQTKKPWYKKWWVITIAVVAVLYSVGNNATEEAKKKMAENPVSGNQAPVQDTKKVETATSAKPEAAAPAVIVTSANISKEYSENEVAADAKYKGKTIEITGKVNNIDNGISDNEMIVRLSDGKYDFNNPWCYMKESERDKVLALKKGQQVTLIGTGDSATLKSPVLKGCTVK